VDALAFLNEVNFDCTATGIAMQALDPAHVSLVSLLIAHDGFEHYRCDRPMTLGINLESLAKILKCAGNEDSLTLRAEDNGDRLSFSFSFNNRVSEFELSLNTIDLEKLTIPDSEYVATVKLPSGEYQKIISNLTTLGDSVNVSVAEGNVKFSVQGPTSGSINLTQTANVDDESSTVVAIKEDISLNFAMRYMGYFTKATNLSSYVTLSLSPEVPLLVEYQIEDGAVPLVKAESGDSKKKVKGGAGARASRGYIRYYLAPKIDDE
jgi:proliferating cell nuclear antigen